MKHARSWRRLPLAAVWTALLTLWSAQSVLTLLLEPSCRAAHVPACQGVLLAHDAHGLLVAGGVWVVGLVVLAVRACLPSVPAPALGRCAAAAPDAR